MSEIREKAVRFINKLFLPKKNWGGFSKVSSLVMAQKQQSHSVIFPRRFGKFPLSCTISLDESKGNLAKTSWQKNSFIMSRWCGVWFLSFLSRIVEVNMTSDFMIIRHERVTNRKLKITKEREYSDITASVSHFPFVKLYKLYMFPYVKLYMWRGNHPAVSTRHGCAIF